jgi:putative tricarboxylic transport membrane protein
MTPVPETPPKSRPVWLGLVVLGMGAVWLNGVSGIAATTNFVGVGPKAMVMVVGVGLVVLGVLLMLQAWRGELVPESSEPPSYRAFLLALAGVALPLATIQWLGFPLTAMASFTLVTHAFGSRRTLLDLCIGFALAAGSWWGFSHLGISLGGFLPFLG